MIDEKRHLDAMLNDKQQLLLDSLSEIAGVLNDSLHTPISANLLCLTFGITNDEKEKLISAFRRVLLEHKSDNLPISLFKKELEAIRPPAIPNGYSDFFVRGIMKAFALHDIPELDALCIEPAVQ